MYSRYRYIVPFALVFLTFLPRLLLHRVLEERSALVLFTLAVMGSAWYGGLRSGLLATVLSGTLGTYFFLMPFQGEHIADIALFTFAGVGISWMAEQLRLARTRAEISERNTRAAHQQITEILESISDGFLALDRDFRFTYLNSTAEQLFGKPKGSLQGNRIFDEFPELFGADVESMFRRAMAGGGMVQFERYFEASSRWLELNVYPSRAGGLSVYFTDITDRKNAEREREGLIGELQSALSQVKALSGLLPICANCKKIRDPKGSWRQLETYIREHSEADFTHSLCPECVDRLYPELTDLS